MADPSPTDLAQDAQAIYNLLGPQPMALINACFILVTIGQILLNLLLGTLLFSGRVRERNATLINLLLVSVQVTVPPALLYYAGYILDPNPPAGLCIVQAVLKHGTDPMFIVASSALVLEVFFDAGLIVVPLSKRVRRNLLVALPYAVFLLFAIWTAVLAGTDTSSVQHEKNSVFCTVIYTSFGRGIEYMCVVIIFFTIILELYAFVFFRRIWRNVARTSLQLRNNTTSFTFINALRVIGFTSMQLFYFVLVGLNFYVNSVATRIIPTVYEALMPLATFFVFGTTVDCMNVWKSWLIQRPNPPDTAAEDPPSRHSAEKIAVSISPAVNEARMRGDELSVIDIC